MGAECKRRPRASHFGLAPAVALLPLGLALIFFPLMWNTGVEAF